MTERTRIFAGVASGTVMAGALWVLPGPCTSFNDAHVRGNADAGEKEAGPLSLPDGGAYLSPDDALNVCSKIWTCRTPPLGASIQTSLGVLTSSTDNFSICLEWLAGPIPSDRVGFAEQQQRLACVAQKQTCAGALDCLPWVDSPPECNIADAGNWCDGGVLYACPGASVRVNCADSVFGPGATCDPLAPGCFASTACQVSACVGSQSVFCRNQVETGTLDCSLSGLTCDTTSGRCATPGSTPPCSFNYVDCSNTGGVALVCGAASPNAGSTGRAYSPFNCSTLGATCRFADGGARDAAFVLSDLYCALPGEQCDPFDLAFTTCTDSTHIRVCVAGVPAILDCSGILPGSNGSCYATGGASAHCSVPWPPN